MTHSKTLTFDVKSRCSCPTLWQAWTAPMARSLWLVPPGTEGFRIVESDTRIGGHEVLLIEGNGTPDVTATSEWLELSAPLTSINTEVMTSPAGLIGACIVTGELSPSDKGARLKVTLQLTCRERSMERVYRQGFEASLARMLGVAERLLVIRAMIPASPQEIWAEWMSSDALPRWWAPDGFHCITKRIDLREGGEWLFDMISSEGEVFPNHHLYHRLLPQRRIDYSLLWREDGPKHADTWAALQPGPQGTTVTLGMIFATPQECAEARRYGAYELGLQTLAKLSEAVTAPQRAR